MMLKRIMPSRILVYLGVAMLLASAVVASAQSLADVARAEEARRKTVKARSKTYTNDDLKGGGSDSSPVASPSVSEPAPGAKPAEAAGKPDPVKEAAAQDPKKDEKYWRDRITAAQQSLARNTVLVDALQSRVNALNTDFVNADDPGQRALVEQNRTTALTEMARVKKDIDTKTKEIATIQEEARKANVPPGWLR
jgi:hypothetical protein